jgi:hypothetical protein
MLRRVQVICIVLRRWLIFWNLVSAKNLPAKSEEVFVNKFIVTTLAKKKYLWVKFSYGRRWNIHERGLPIDGDLDIGMVRGDRTIHRDSIS